MREVEEIGDSEDTLKGTLKCLEMKRDQHIWRTTELDHRVCEKVSRGHKGYGLVLLCCENNEHHEFSTSD